MYGYVLYKSMRDFFIEKHGRFCSVKIMGDFTVEKGIDDCSMENVWESLQYGKSTRDFGI